MSDRSRLSWTRGWALLGLLALLLWTVARLVDWTALWPSPAPPAQPPQPAPAERAPTQPPLYAPYLDVNEALRSGLPLPAKSYVSLWRPSRLPVAAHWAPIGAVTLAFATGSCAQEAWSWHAVSGERVRRHLIDPLRAAGLRYIVSTGGAGARFVCNRPADFDTFIARYASPELIGFDFDIEWKQTEAEIDTLVHQVALAAQRHPGLRWSFTLAVSAAEGEAPVFNATGRAVLQALQRHGLQQANLNLMVMNYGPPRLKACPAQVGGQSCDMLAATRRVLERVRALTGWPARQIALTPMLGVNEEPGNVWRVDDVFALRALATELGVGALHHWSINRDRSCSQPSPRAARDDCHGLPDLPALAFARVLGQATSAGPQ